MLTKDEIHTLVDVVIVDPTQVDLFPQFCNSRICCFNVVKAKKKGCHDQHLTNQILPLAIHVFGCLHKHVDVFLHDCANAIWSFKGPKALLFLF